MLLSKYEVCDCTLNSTEVLISKNLIDSYIDHDEFVLVNNVLKEGIKNLKI